MKNISYQLSFDSRAPYIRYFFNIASGVKSMLATIKHEKPIFISLIGDPMSGKELVALAFDMAFRPERYSNGEIGRNVKADDVLSPTNSGYVCFHGSGTKILKPQSGYDAHLANYERIAPKARVHFVSNVIREEGVIPNYDDGFNSDLLDMAITIRKDGESNLLREGGIDAVILDRKLNSFRRIAQINTRPRTRLNKIVDGVKP